MKIERDPQAQTITFELPQLPGEIFSTVIPEVISDAKEPIVPWHHPSPNWEIEQDFARWSTHIEGVAHMEAEVRFRGEQIETWTRVCNLSPRTWEQVSAFICFKYWQAPSFDDPDLSRTFFPVDEGWKSVAQLFAEHNPGDGPYTFFAVAGGPALGDLWVCRQIPQWHPQVVARGCGCVISRDGQWVAGMSTPRPAYVFNNRRKRCLHADPLLGTVAPGESAEGGAAIYVFRGGLGDFSARCM